MADRFPHLSDPSTFPGTDNINVYKYPNDFDYSRYDNAQMTITLCSVPWDLGEAHVGNRTIEGVGNVVDFGDTDTRDEYFDTLDDSVCYRFTTKYRHFHAGDNQIKVPVPVTALADYNYVEVKYNTEPTAANPLEYETNKVSRWYYFIRDFEQAASNTTVCNLMIDTWQTYIYFVDIPYMYLERGHYPVAQCDADAYLSNPLENSEWLQGEDPSFGNLTREAKTDSVCFNDTDSTMYACICSSASYTESAFGTKYDEDDWRCYATPNRMMNGTPSTVVYAMLASDLSDFLTTIDSEAPQYKQSIQGVFFISDNLISTVNSYDFFGTTVYSLQTAQHSFNLIDLDKSDWDYAPEYADLAKLYTYPYTAIDVYSENGDVIRINVEDTTGNLDVIARVQLTFPWINIDARLRGYGSGNTYQISYQTANTYNFDFGGTWYDTLKTWNVPVYGVIQDMTYYNQFATYWSRQQNAYAATNRRSNANATAETNQENAEATATANYNNANASASTERSNANAEADTQVSNAAVQTSANSTINSTSNACANEICTTDNEYQSTTTTITIAVNRGTTNNSVDAADRQATQAAATSVASSAANGVMSGLTGGGLISAAVGGVSGLISGGISAANIITQNNIATDLTEENAGILNDNYRTLVEAAETHSILDTESQTSTNTSNTATQNNAITSTAANSAALINANASRNYSTDTANAQRTYNAEVANAERTYNTEVANATRDYNTAIEANNNQVREARLGAPQLFGNLQNGESGINRPQAYFATIVKQPDGAIAQAGDMFLRYGYTLNRVVPFETFNVMPKFSYWQCSDMWLRSSTVPDAYMDQIRLLLFGGVTVWRDPADIGNVSIYENK